MRQEDIIEIINRIKDGHRSAFTDLTKSTIGMAMTVARNILIDSRDAEDAVQEVYIKVWNNLGSYSSDKGQFSTWFFKIIQNECFDRNRKIKHQNNWPLSGDLEESCQPIDEMLHFKELKNRVITISHTLPTKQREIFVLRDIQNMSMKEVRETTGLSLGTIKSNLYLARKKIKEIIEREENKK